MGVSLSSWNPRILSTKHRFSFLSSSSPCGDWPGYDVAMAESGPARPGPAHRHPVQWSSSGSQLEMPQLLSHEKSHQTGARSYSIAGWLPPPLLHTTHRPLPPHLCLLQQDIATLHLACNIYRLNDAAWMTQSLSFTSNHMPAASLATSTSVEPTLKLASNLQ